MKKTFTRWTREHDELAQLAVASNPGLNTNDIMREMGWPGGHSTVLAHLRTLVDRGKLARSHQKGKHGGSPYLYYPAPTKVPTAKSNGAPKPAAVYTAPVAPAPALKPVTYTPVITLQLPRGVPLELTPTEARTLYDQLRILFG